MTPAPNPRAWAVAAALAGDADWARWARGETIASPAMRCPACGAREAKNDRMSQFHIACQNAAWLYPLMRPDGWLIDPAPVPAPWDADAYQADCARRGVEPGPLPSLSWTGPDGFGWEVTEIDGVLVCVAFTQGDNSIAWWVPNRPHAVRSCDMITWDGADPDVPLALVARIVNLATAAKRAMGGP